MTCTRRVRPSANIRWEHRWFQADDVRVGDGPFRVSIAEMGIGLKIVHDSWNTILVIPNGLEQSWSTGMHQQQLRPGHSVTDHSTRTGYSPTTW
jgi:hypothetical protein